MADCFDADSGETIFRRGEELLDREALRFEYPISKLGRWRVDPNFDALTPNESPKPSMTVDGAGGIDGIPNASNF